MNFEKLFKLAKEKGIEDIQVTISEDNETQIEVLDKELSSFSITSSSVLSARGIYKGKMGHYSTEIVSEKEFPVIVDKIIQAASVITIEDEVFIYEGDKKYKKIKNEFNKELANVPVKEKLDLSFDLNNSLCSKENTQHAESGYGEAESTLIMANSKGLKLKKHDNGFQAYAYTIAEKDGDVRTGVSIWSHNDYNTIDKESIANESHNIAVSSLGAKPTKTGTYEVIFDEHTAKTLLSTFSGFFSSERAQKNMSILKGKVGEKIASSKVTIVDDPFLLNSSRSRSFDSEGVATEYKEIVKNGVFKGFLYNLKTAKIDGIKSTGNARGADVGPINLYFKPGKHSKEEMISSIKDGLLITGLAGMHSGANAYSGDFSLQATGYRIVDGKVSDPVALITVSQNFFGLLTNIEEVSSELKNTVECPAIKVKGIAVAGC